MADDDPDISLSIPLKSIYDEFICPICFNVFENAHMTPCGHNFCEECIKECLNRKHICPCCNFETVKEKLVKNHQMDKMVEAVEREKDAASQAYFNNLLNRSKDNTPQASTEGGGGAAGSPAPKSRELSPIEQLFHTHMKRGLSAYEDYFQELKRKNDKEVERIREDHAGKMAKAQAKIKKATTAGKTAKRSEQKLAKLAASCDEQCALSAAALERSTSLLIQSYDQFLKENMPVPAFLPIKLTVILDAQGIRLDNITLKPADTLTDLRRIVAGRLAERGDPLMEWGNSVFQMNTEEKGGAVVFKDEALAAVHLHIPPGTEVHLTGQAQLKSDAPASCFTATFEKGKNQTCDYFTCKTCGFNWICQACAQNCHKGHVIVDHIRNHKPTWSCCYCVKNRKCKIPNSKTKK
eukprot:TRINITY_DN15127_c0_g1_i2.p1 TRINITY_DN15127_c0_g1~~TRINITY_DN15127_c0_g1_i2.p1  ORF type:complete len:428 (+),score=72.09 TRINITY_DN15127_c0_g1_i2:58-1284(+)